MTFLIDNWYMFVAIIAVLIVIVAVAIKFFRGNWKNNLAKVREWLLYAVTVAEKELGSGTGALKLRYVYDMFTVKFPWLVKVVSFEMFSELVDDALDELMYMLKCNEAIEEYVVGQAPIIETTTETTKEGE